VLRGNSIKILKMKIQEEFTDILKHCVTQAQIAAPQVTLDKISLSLRFPVEK